MSINFAMWRKATSTLVRMDNKQEWEALDVVSKWLIATRSGVTTVTLYSCTIAGLLALRSGSFPWLTWLICTVGLFLAHGANNLLNDYTDYTRGIDNDNYFRTQYGVHPLVQGFWDKKTQIRWFVVSGVLALLAALFAILETQFDPVVIGLCIYGALMLLLYTYPLKYFALGELTIFLIWGPIMIGGVYFVLTRQWSWNVALAGISLRAQHGQHQHRQAHRQVRGGQAEGRDNAACSDRGDRVTLPQYGGCHPGLFDNDLHDRGSAFLHPGGSHHLLCCRPRVESSCQDVQAAAKGGPAGDPIWPRWFSTVAFMHNRRFGNLFILGVALDTVIRLVFPLFWR